MRRARAGLELKEKIMYASSDSSLRSRIYPSAKLLLQSYQDCVAFVCNISSRYLFLFLGTCLEKECEASYTSLSDCLKIFASVCLSACMFLCLRVCLHMFVRVSAFVRLYVCMSVYMSVCLSVSLRVSACLFVCVRASCTA